MQLYTITNLRMKILSSNLKLQSNVKSIAIKLQNEKLIYMDSKQGRSFGTDRLETFLGTIFSFKIHYKHLYMQFKINSFIISSSPDICKDSFTHLTFCLVQ